MEINKLLENVSSVDEYISATQAITDNCKNTKVQINFTTVHALKKIRSLEIEYLNKCYENGAACIIFERLLDLPPSKTWGTLAKDLVSLLQYWLEAIRKYLITHNAHWWSFLKLILKFIKEIRNKDPSMPNVLVELSAECLFDLATQDIPDFHQRHDILHGLNVFSAEASREIRLAMSPKFGDYFAKLAAILTGCGYLPCQYVSLEALVRWLVPRHDSALRAAKAAVWFPAESCPSAATEIFLSTNWMSFVQDARNFLNTLNKAKKLVTSVVCRKLAIGNVTVISGTEKQETWLDINSEGKCVTVMLDPRVLDTFGVMDRRSYETLVIDDDSTDTITLYSEPSRVYITVHPARPPRVVPAGVVVGPGDVTLTVTSSTVHLTHLDAALRRVFTHKYYEEDRFSHPVEIVRRPHSGYISRTRHTGLVSPSTVSTSSLTQLHDKLAALPRFRYDKEPVSICAKPQLSNVTEISESDDRSFHSATTLRIRQYGVSSKNYSLPPEQPTQPTKKQAGSDSETLKVRPKLRRHLSPLVIEEDSASCLLVATVGSANESVINDTIERLNKSKQVENDDIVDLLVQEALGAKPLHVQAKELKKINSQNEENSEAIENTPIQDGDKETSKKKRIALKKVCTVVSTTEDESNTEAINETPISESQRKKTLKRKPSVRHPVELKANDKPIFDNRAVENIFSQHISEAKTGDIIISPSLAKKLNESSSDTSKDFDANDVLIDKDKTFEFDEIDIIECLNNMVDKVCSDLDKCTEYINSENMDDNYTNVLQESNKNITTRPSRSESKPKRNVKLTYNTPKIKKTPKKAAPKKRKSSIKQQPKKKLSTIIEQKGKEIIPENLPKQHYENIELSPTDSIQKENEIPATVQNLETSIRRKRKLYSPKDDQIEKECKETIVSETEDDDIVLSKLKTYKSTTTPKSIASCYKELTRERQNRIRLPRSRKSRGKVEESPSPRTLKIDALFDKVKSSIESNKNINYVNKTDIYNLTSDSEDSDFVKKTMDIRKRASNTTVGSFESTISTRKSRQRKRPNYSEISSNDEVKKTRSTRNRKPAKKSNKKSKANVAIEPAVDLEDERMRHADPNVLDSSIVLDKPESAKATVEVTIHEPPQMEEITDDQKTTTPGKKIANKRNKKTNLSEKKHKDVKKDKHEIQVQDKEEDSSMSSLIVEAVPSRKNCHTDLVKEAIIQKIKELDKIPCAIDESLYAENVPLDDTNEFNIEHNQEQINETEISSNKKENKKNDQQKQPLVKIKKNSFRKEREDLDISDETHCKSIASDHITAHGCFDEAPPSEDMLRKSIQHRDLVDLDESMKDYFLKIYREINHSTSKDCRESSTDKVKITKSPVVCIERLSSNYINEWLPSRRASTSVNSSKSGSPSLKTADKEPKFDKDVTPKKASESVKIQYATSQIVKSSIISQAKSPVVPVVPLSSDELEKWLPMPPSPVLNDEADTNIKSIQKQSKLKLVYKTNSKVNTSIDIKSPEADNKQARIEKPKPHTRPWPAVKEKNKDTINKTPQQDSGFISSRIKSSKKALDSAKAIESIDKTVPIDIDLDENEPVISKLRSKKSLEASENNAVISPIKDFEDFVSHVSKNAESDEYQFVTKRKKVTSNEEVLGSIKPRCIESPRSTSTRLNVNTPNSCKSSVSKINSLTAKIEIPTKRKSSPLRSEFQTEVSENLERNLEIGPIAPSVSDWFLHTAPSGSAFDINMSVEETLQNILEKLNTTLTEMNHDTSKMLVKTILETAAGLAAHKQALRNEMKSAAKDILATMVSLIDEKFAYLDQRAQDANKEFIEELKKLTYDLVRKDCQRKRALVNILKQDVEAVLEYIKGHRSESP